MGYPEGPVVRVVLDLFETKFASHPASYVNDIFQQVVNTADKFLQDPLLSAVAEALLQKTKSDDGTALTLTGIPYQIFGAEHIEESARLQMDTAARLPVSVAGALMPDAHHGYGLPIGGVLATRDAIIPYAVGVDIGCRMCLSIFDIMPETLKNRPDYFKKILTESTLFGAGKDFGNKKMDAEVMHNKIFDDIPFIRELKGKASVQLGSSGSGNHFAEFGIVNVEKNAEHFNLPAGKYVALLTHSGSRGLGATIAAHYTQLAMKQTKLPSEAKHLAWLDMSSEEGQEYFMSMNLAGDYASACHDVIHKKVARALGEDKVTRVENHHNFAWKEEYNGETVYVHRKGATPAGKNVLGIIPGSMTAPGYIVSGRGNASSLNSASHGAGRKMSRTKALASITSEALKAELKLHDVTLIGGGLDEAPFAYKDINDIMKSQEDLVDIVGTFKPNIVIMDEASPKKNRFKKK